MHNAITALCNHPSRTTYSPPPVFSYPAGKSPPPLVSRLNPPPCIRHLATLFSYPAGRPNAAKPPTLYPPPAALEPPPVSFQFITPSALAVLPRGRLFSRPPPAAGEPTAYRGQDVPPLQHFLTLPPPAFAACLYPPPCIRSRPCCARTRTTRAPPTLQLPDKSKSRQIEKLESWQVGTHPPRAGQSRGEQRTPHLTRLNVPTPPAPPAYTLHALAVLPRGKRKPSERTTQHTPPAAGEHPP